MIAPVAWPDTSTDAPPADHSYASAAWLLGRHPMLSALAQRIPEVVTVDDEGPYFDQDALTRAIAEYDSLLDAHRVLDDDRLDAQLGEAGYAFARMSRTEQTRLRLLAFFGSERVGLRVADLHGLDAGGQLLLADWLEAVRSA